MKKLALTLAAFVATAPIIIGSGAAFATTTYTPTLVKQFDTNNDSGFAVDSIIPFSDTKAIVLLANDDLWLTDGTTDGTTDITQDASDAGLTEWDFQSSTWQRSAIADGNGNVYFKGYDTEWNIWKFDGTNFTQVSTDNFEWINEVYLLDGDVYLWGRNYDENYSDDTLYQIALPSGSATEIIGGNGCDGAQREARQVSFVDPYIVFANDTSNNCNYTIMSWDTTNPGNNPVDLSAATGASGSDTEFAQWDDRYVWNGELYFGGRTTNGDYELWTTNGTVAGTSLLKDINSGSDGSGYPGYDSYLWFTEYNGELYFAAEDGSDVYMYKTDGTESGTVKAVTTLTNPNDSIEAPGVAFDGKLAVSFNDPTYGEELFLTDGTDAGTTLIKDIDTNGTDGSLCWRDCVVPVVFDNHLFFAADDSTGNAVWVTDGTDAGTTQLTNFDSYRAIGDYNEFALVPLGTHLLFGVTDYSDDGGTGEMSLYTLDAPESGLASTGVDATGIALGGVAALVAGAVVVLRRRARV